MSRDLEAQLSGVAALNDPMRRRLYELVVASDEPVSREQAASALGIQRALAAFHLEKLVGEGLLDVEFRRLTGRTGPGAGRPAKLYLRSDAQIDVSLPPREYDLAGLLLAGAIDSAGDGGRSVRAELDAASHELGRRIGEEAVAAAGSDATPDTLRTALIDVLRERGFEPRAVDGGDVVLSNCPFHALAQSHRDLVCGMNLQLLRGVRSALDVDDDELRPRLEPEPGQCCVKFCTG